MAVLGVFGDVVFEVSAKKVRTFDEFSRNTADRWENHNRIGLKPASEFIGPGLDRISFTMIFDVAHGVNPRKEMENILIMSRNGQVNDLTIGEKGLGVNKWKITSLRQGWKVVDNKGNLLRGTLDVELEEYI